MPKNQNNPKHKTLAAVVGAGLTPLGPVARWRVAGLIGPLYNFRVIADYMPLVTLTSVDARIALGLMTKAFVDLKRVP